MGKNHLKYPWDLGTDILFGLLALLFLILAAPQLALTLFAVLFVVAGGIAVLLAAALIGYGLSHLVRRINRA